MAQLSSTLAAGNLISEFQTRLNSNQTARLRLKVSFLVIAGTTLSTRQKYVCADQITQRGSAITVHSNGHNCRYQTVRLPSLFVLMLH